MNIKYFKSILFFNFLISLLSAKVHIHELEKGFWIESSQKIPFSCFLTKEDFFKIPLKKPILFVSFDMVRKIHERIANSWFTYNPKKGDCFFEDENFEGKEDLINPLLFVKESNYKFKQPPKNGCLVCVTQKRTVIKGSMLTNLLEENQRIRV